LIWFDSKVNQVKQLSTLFKNLRANQPVDSKKQQVVFHLVRKTSIFKTVLNHISFRFNKGVDYTLIQIPPTQSNNSNLSSNTLDLDSSKLLITLDQQSPPI